MSIPNSQLFWWRKLCRSTLLAIVRLCIQFSRLVLSDFLWPHGLQHARLPCPSPTPGACSSSCPSSWWCHPTISSSAVPFSCCFQSFAASESFIKSQFTSGGQNIGVSASACIQGSTINYSHSAVRSLGLHFITENVCFSSPWPCRPLCTSSSSDAITSLLSISTNSVFLPSFLSDSTHKWDHVVFIRFHLTYFV